MSQKWEKEIYKKYRVDCLSEATRPEKCALVKTTVQRYICFTGAHFSPDKAVRASKSKVMKVRVEKVQMQI